MVIWFGGTDIRLELVNEIIRRSSYVSNWMESSWMCNHNYGWNNVNEGEMVSLNIIGDIAGNYETLQALLKKMPDGEIISLGDMIDRGPKSKQVVDFLMKNGKAVMGNHEHMMLDWIHSHNQKRPGVYQEGIWEMNGGLFTQDSYKDKEGNVTIPDEHIAWLMALPNHLEYDDVTLTHAPINPVFGLHRAAKIDYRDPNSLGWNRGNINRADKFQIYGHQGLQQIKWHEDKLGRYGVCIDTCNYGWRDGHKGILTGIHWPTKDIYQQDIID